MCSNGYDSRLLTERCEFDPHHKLSDSRFPGCLFISLKRKAIILMVVIKIWDNTPIDTSSNKIKNEVSKGVVKYITDHWNECVKSTNEINDKKYETQFFITL